MHPPVIISHRAPDECKQHVNTESYSNGREGPVDRACQDTWSGQRYEEGGEAAKHISGPVRPYSFLICEDKKKIHSTHTYLQFFVPLCRYPRWEDNIKTNQEEQKGEGRNGVDSCKPWSHTTRGAADSKHERISHSRIYSLSLTASKYCSNCVSERTCLLVQLPCLARRGSVSKQRSDG
jgi:hypothetical protein